MNEPKSETRKCDYCGKPNARWFGQTAVAVCDSPKCQQRNQDNWEIHCAAIEYSYDDSRWE